MSKKDLKTLIQKRDTPIVIINLEFYAQNKENTTPPNPFDHTFSASEFEHKHISIPDFRSRALSKLKKLQQSKSLQNHNQEKKHNAWTKKLEKLEDSTKNSLWVIKNHEPALVSGSEAEKDDNYITPHYFTNPDRFSIEYTPATPLIDFSLRHTHRKVNDILSAHLIYKSHQVWSIPEIKTFLYHFFKTPKKFEEIKKFLPEKSTKEIIQLFYLLKYQFKLKKHLRIQARKKKEEIISDHTRKIIALLKKKFPGQDHISQEGLAKLTNFKKITNREVYFEKFGKDTSKIQNALKDFQDYSRYKENAFGGERVTDEGPLTEEEDGYRKGSSQWTYEEKMMFLKHFKQNGRNWVEISRLIGSKTPSQVRNFFQNYKKKLKLDSIDNEVDEKSLLEAAGITNKLGK